MRAASFATSRGLQSIRHLRNGAFSWLIPYSRRVSDAVGRRQCEQRVSATSRGWVAKPQHAPPPERCIFMADPLLAAASDALRTTWCPSIVLSFLENKPRSPRPGEQGVLTRMRPESLGCVWAHLYQTLPGLYHSTAANSVNHAVASDELISHQFQDEVE